LYYIGVSDNPETESGSEILVEFALLFLLLIRQSIFTGRVPDLRGHVVLISYLDVGCEVGLVMISILDVDCEAEDGRSKGAPGLVEKSVQTVAVS
jgi:hypothetical protein